jgi:hypothetical protein
MYVNDYQFRYREDGIVLNNDASVPTVGNPIWDITKVSGMDLPDVKVSAKDHDGYDGGAVEAQFYATRVITLEGTLFCHPSDSLELWLDKLKKNYAPTNWSQGFPSSGAFFYAKAPGAPEKFTGAYSLGVKYDWDTSRRFNSQSFKIMLQCAQPQWYSLTGKVLGPSAVGAGLTYYNEGNYANTGLIKIKNADACVNPVVTLTSPGFGRAIPITATVPSGGYEIWIDLGQRVVLLQQGFNSTNWRNRVTSEAGWFRFAPGMNVIKLTTSGGGAPTLNLEINDQWM